MNDVPVRVAHITTIDMGLRYLLLNQLVSLKREGYEVFGISRPGPDVEALTSAGIPHLPVPLCRTPLSPLADLKAFVALVRVLARLRPTIVHTHNPKPTLYGQIAARLTGVPIVVNTLHGYLFQENSPLLVRQAFIAIERLAARFVDVVLSQNREDLETACRTGICPPSRIKHLGNGIDLERFDPARVPPEAITALREEFRLGPGDLVVGFVGRLVREKGVLELLAAAGQLKETHPEARYLFVGPVDTHKPDCVGPELARDYGVEEVCRFTRTMRDDMPELYRLMDVLVLPSHREGYPRAPMEASAMGIPSIVTDIRGCREVVDEGVNGLLVPRCAPAALAAALRTLLGKGALRQALGQRGRQVARERFDETLVFDKVKREYEELLRLKRLRSPHPTRV